MILATLLGSISDRLLEWWMLIRIAYLRWQIWALTALRDRLRDE